MEDNNITIGSDPEFVIMCGDSVSNALEIFSKVYPEIKCAPKLNVIEEYNKNKDSYLGFALNCMSTEYLIDNFHNILKDDNETSVSKIVEVIIKYYDNYSYPAWNKIPKKVQNLMEESMSEEYSDSNFTYEMHFCSAEIGCDGYSVTGEMRPRFGNEPIKHFNEILRLIKELEERLKPDIVCYDKELQVKAGTVHGPIYSQSLLGGHIHIGYDVEQRVYIAKYLGLMLSMFVGIPLTLIEKPEEIHKRHRMYGKWNDVRPKDYGLEFRMPSSWLVSPEITIGALSLAYVVADEFITKYSESKKSSSIDLLFEDTTKYEHIYNKMLYETASDDIDTYYYDALVSMSELLYENIKTMRLYPEYAEYIDYIFDMIKKYEYWNSDADILTTWSELF